MQEIEWRSAAGLRALAEHGLLASLALSCLVAMTVIPGLFSLPPVDRTEVFYAQAARQMLSSGEWLSPRFQETPQHALPLVMFWVQAASAKLLSAEPYIWAYRLPSALGGLLAVLFTYWGARPIFGPQTAFIGAGLLATSIVFVLQSHLAIPEPIFLAAVVAGQLALARIYTAALDEPVTGAAVVFWTAQGVGILLNVLTLPVLSLLTIAALIVVDRRADWLKRLRVWPGIVLTLAIAAIWPVFVLLSGHADDVWSAWRAGLPDTLLGAQAMKWRKVPGLFIVIGCLGLFPGLLYLRPALQRAWRTRLRPEIRFLLAWIVPYLIVLEVLSGKPPLYMVQSVLPPLTLAMASWLTADPEPGEATVGLGYRIGIWLWVVLALVFIAAVPVLGWFVGHGLEIGWLVLAIAAGCACVFAAFAIQLDRRTSALAGTQVAAVLLYLLVLQWGLPSIPRIWPSQQIARAVEIARTCAPHVPASVSLTGYNAPSSVFLAGNGTLRTYALEHLLLPRPPNTGFAFVESRWLEVFLWYRQQPGAKPANRIACFSGVSLRGCKIRMTLYAFSDGSQTCDVPPDLICHEKEPKPQLEKVRRLHAKKDRCL